MVEGHTRHTCASCLYAHISIKTYEVMIQNECKRTQVEQRLVILCTDLLVLPKTCCFCSWTGQHSLARAALVLLSPSVHKAVDQKIYDMGVGTLTQTVVVVLKYTRQSCLHYRCSRSYTSHL